MRLIFIKITLTQPIVQPATSAMIMIINCFQGMVEQWKVLSLISSQNHCLRFSPLQISDMPLAGFEPAQNLSSGFVEGSCAEVITNTPWCHKILYDILYELLHEH